MEKRDLPEWRNMDFFNIQNSIFKIDTGFVHPKEKRDD